MPVQRDEDVVRFLCVEADGKNLHVALHGAVALGGEGDVFRDEIAFKLLCRAIQDEGACDDFQGPNPLIR